MPPHLPAPPPPLELPPVNKFMQYLINHGGLVPFDGDGMREYLVDEYVRDDSEPPLVEGLRAGSLLEVPRGEVSRQKQENSVLAQTGEG